MHQLTIFPIGNADCCLIDTENGKKILIDYANLRDPNNDTDLRIDLKSAIEDNLNAAGRTSFDVVVFTHVDDDHIHGATEIFHLEHAKKYQGNSRIKINELWVPAAMIVETGLKEEAQALQAEARYRLCKGTGIRVFSRPKKLKEWLKKQGLTLESRRHLITDAGELVPGFTKESERIEFFIHSPFVAQLNDNELDRNNCSLVFQATFYNNEQETKFILSADTSHEVLTEIIKVTKLHDNHDRLAWDIVKIPHHCSYRSLSDEKGVSITEPNSEIKWLYEEQGNKGGILISTSKPIPTDDSDKQPPHRQAANYYKQCAKAIGGEFKVTMEHPKSTAPKPLIITIDKSGATVQKRILGSSGIITSRPAPRAG